MREYTLIDFSGIFSDEQGRVIEINIAQPNPHLIDAQKLHLIFQRLKEVRVILSSWEIIKEKIKVYNQSGEIVHSVYQLSRGKISSIKLPQVEKLLNPILELMPI